MVAVVPNGDMSFQVREALRAAVPPELVCDQLDAGRSGRELGHQVGAWGGEGSQHGWSYDSACCVMSAKHPEKPRGLGRWLLVLGSQETRRPDSPCGFGLRTCLCVSPNNSEAAYCPCMRLGSSECPYFLDPLILVFLRPFSGSL